jgi:hypothetical protein
VGLAASHSKDSRTSSVPFLVVVGLIAIAYGRSFHGEFQFDDYAQILTNPLMQDPTWGALFRWGRTRTLPFATLAFNYRLGGEDPFGYHVVNVVVHLLVSFLVYRVAIALCRTPRLRGTQLWEHQAAFALVAAALFACHPIQVQAVTYIVQRMSSLAALFYLGAVLAYVHARTVQTTSDRGRPAVAYATALVLAVVATFCKETAASLPAAIALTEIVLFAPIGGLARAAARILPFGLIALTSTLVFTMLDPRPIQIPRAEPADDIASAPHEAESAGPRRPSAPTPASEWKTTMPVDSLRDQLNWLVAKMRRAANPPKGVSVGAYVLTQSRVIPRYFALVVLPWGFNIDHDVPFARDIAEVAPGIALLAAIVAFGLYAAYRWPIVGFAVLWVFVALSVESLMPLYDPMNEHRMYLAMLGPALLVGYGFARWRSVSPVPARLAAAAVIVALVALTATRNEVWRTQRALWQDAATKSPHKARPFLNLGTALFQEGDLQGAMDLYCQALRIEPTNTSAEANIQLALANLMQEGKVELEIVSTEPDGTMELVPHHPCPPAEPAKQNGDRQQ